MGVANSTMAGGTRVASGMNNNNNNKEIAIDRHTLEAYLKCEKDISAAEAKNPLQPLDLKSEQLQKLILEIEEKEEHVKQLSAETAKEQADVELLEHGKDVKSTLLQMGANYEEQMTKEKAEYVAALNKQEIGEQELQTIRTQKDKVQDEVEELEKNAHVLQELYKKQDTLLDKMFGGAYGSMMENQLEQELDQLESHRGRILEANFKWRQAQMMLEYACKQMAVAVQKWQDLPTLPTIDLEVRYRVAAETRNNLVAAGQNLHGAQRYLDNVHFPYCDPAEVSTLNKQATEYVFTDMQSADRHEHAYTCYTTTHKRANALLQWFDTVINTTILRDLTDINDKVKGKTLELRRERVRLIQAKIREMWGSDVDLEETLKDQDLDLESMARTMLNSAQAARDENDRMGTPGLLSNSELAPVPSNNIIFGSMYDTYQNQLDVIANRHQEELKSFMKEQEQNQKKIRGTLEDKLILRRQRRARQKLEEAQKSAMMS